MDQKARACRLLSDLSPPSRQRLTTMPCDVRRLLRQRFRGHGDDVAKTAFAVWEGDVGPDALRAALAPPLDARLWLTPWPAFALAGAALGRRLGVSERAGDPLPAPEARVFQALAALHRIDPISHLLVLDGLRGTLDVATWRSSLGASDAAVSGHLALALFRALVILRDAAARVEPREARTCLVERWLVSAARSEVEALGCARVALGDPSLDMGSFRRLAQEGALAALSDLGGDPATQVVLTASALRAFRRVLKLDADGEDGSADLFGFEEPALALFGRELTEARPRGADGHRKADELVGFALGVADTSPAALPIVEHLACCRDGRCGELVRAEVTGVESVRRMLAGPMSEPPSRPASGAMIGPSSPHMIRCRDVLWETFTAMAQAEGRSVDDLVEDAMDRYRLLRMHLRDGAPSSEGDRPHGGAPRSSRPPTGSRSGLRLGTSSRPPPAPTPVEPSHQVHDEESEPTVPRRPKG
jgi:hypothetical protein